MCCCFCSLATYAFFLFDKTLQRLPRLVLKDSYLVSWIEDCQDSHELFQKVSCVFLTITHSNSVYNCFQASSRKIFKCSEKVYRVPAAIHLNRLQHHNLVSMVLVKLYSTTDASPNGCSSTFIKLSIFVPEWLQTSFQEILTEIKETPTGATFIAKTSSWN